MPILSGKKDPAQRSQHWEQSTTSQSLVEHSRGSTLEKLRVEQNRADGAQGEIPWGEGLGPVGNRYIRDPLDPSQNGGPGGVIDMRHFIESANVPLSLGEGVGAIVEFDQQRRGFPSAHYEEDYKSNFLGVVFRNNYWKDDNDVSDEFQKFFDDYSNGQLKGFWPAVDSAVADLSKQGVEGLERLGSFIEDYAKRAGQQGLQQLRNLKRNIENLLQINPVDELRKLYDQLTSAEQVLTAQLDPIQSPEQLHIDTAAVSAAVQPDFDPIFAANEQREQSLSPEEQLNNTLAQFEGTVEQLLQQHQGLASLPTGTLAFSPSIQSVDGILNGEAEPQSAESSQIDQEYRAMRQQQYQDHLANRAQTQQEAGGDQIALG